MFSVVSGREERKTSQAVNTLAPAAGSPPDDDRVTESSPFQRFDLCMEKLTRGIYKENPRIKMALFKGFYALNLSEVLIPGKLGTKLW